MAIKEHYTHAGTLETFSNPMDAVKSAMEESIRRGHIGIKLERCVTYTGESAPRCYTLNIVKVEPNAGIQIVDDQSLTAGQPQNSLEHTMRFTDPVLSGSGETR